MKGSSYGNNKKRITLSIDDDLYREFETLKKQRSETSLSQLILNLAKEVLETNKDLYFTKIAESRSSEKRYSHSKVWGIKKKK